MTQDPDAAAARVNGDILTRWGLVFTMEPAAADAGDPAAPAPNPVPDAPLVPTLEDVFARARTAYLDRCPVLAAFLREQQAEVRATAERAGRAGPAAGDHLQADGALVGVSVVEVRPSSFDMAVRVRRTGEEDTGPVDLRRTLVVERRATGERLPIPREVRDEFIALQLAARDTC